MLLVQGRLCTIPGGLPALQEHQAAQATASGGAAGGGPRAADKLAAAGAAHQLRQQKGAQRGTGSGVALALHSVPLFSSCLLRMVSLQAYRRLVGSEDEEELAELVEEEGAAVTEDANAAAVADADVGALLSAGPAQQAAAAVARADAVAPANAAAAGAADPNEWQQAFDPASGHLYYYREATQVGAEECWVTQQPVCCLSTLLRAPVARLCYTRCGGVITFALSF